MNAMLRVVFAIVQDGRGLRREHVTQTANVFLVDKNESTSRRVIDMMFSIIL